VNGGEKLRKVGKTANVQDGTRLDISMNGFWGGHFEKCYTDISHLLLPTVHQIFN